MNQNKKNYIIIGGICSGKSTVMNFLRENGFKTFSADEIVHELYERKDIVAEVAKIFDGRDILDRRGHIDRKKLSKYLYDEKDKRHELENLIHPMVIREIISLGNENRDEAYFFEIPLYSLIEERLQNSLLYDIISVDCKKDTQIERLMKRQNISLEEAENIISVNDIWKNFKQKPLKIIYNDKNLQDTQRELKLFLIEENLL
ncbi:dephospho-CoA kinase [Lagierella massiliensis]|uniref:dephospho-CoA kinase n=1 Tax=Lagierella massiliensis TaxID=1689303 RepID=UPI0006D7877E|nr:dephospho-CoA kinase [Lagierella massiliensis]